MQIQFINVAAELVDILNDSKFIYGEFD